MKTLVILTVLLSGLLAASAAAVGAAEAAPQEQPEKVQVVEEEVPAVEEEVLAPEEEESSPEGRFFFCPSGWYKFRDGCYRFYNLPYSWQSAAAYCVSNRASLASAHDSFEYNFLQEIARREGSSSTAWIGGFYFQNWRWVDQSPYSYSNFNSVQSISSNPCVYLNIRVGWSNGGCSGGRPFICAKKLSNC